MNPPTVFISYSHDSDEHRRLVHELSARLRSHSINTILDGDVQGGSPPEGWPQWIVNNLRAATRVVCVCTETYQRRFQGQESSDQGKGVDWEGRQISQILYEEHTNKFIPVVFSRSDLPYIPFPLRSHTPYVLDCREGDKAHEALYAAILERTAVALASLPATSPPSLVARRHDWKLWVLGFAILLTLALTLLMLPRRHAELPAVRPPAAPDVPPQVVVAPLPAPDATLSIVPKQDAGLMVSRLHCQVEFRSAYVGVAPDKKRLREICRCMRSDAASFRDVELALTIGPAANYEKAQVHQPAGAPPIGVDEDCARESWERSIADSSSWRGPREVRLAVSKVHRPGAH
jgi:hypothetical protein